MTVYVDRFFGPFDRGRWAGGGHLLTSDLDELHAMARRIGLRRSWFQDKTFPHYDLTASKHRLALAAGVVPIECGEFPDDLLVRRRDGSYECYRDRLGRLLTADAERDDLEQEQFEATSRRAPDG